MIANNQIGFTTDPSDARSTRHSSDLAKGFDVPIIHVNADDPEAALAAVRIAMAFRRRFCHDVVIDLVGYRRHGHNEQDEAAYTQPLMAQQIEQHPSAREQYARRLLEEGVVTEADVEAMISRAEAKLREAHERLREAIGKPAQERDGKIPRGSAAVVTAVAADRLRTLNNELLTVPDDFTVHAKLVKQLLKRGEALDSGGIDWGHAEALALASLLVEGIPGPVDGPGHRARHVLTATSSSTTPRTARCTSDPAAERRGRLVRGLQLAALGVRRGRVRVRLLGRRARVARALGGAVRRLRQRGADRDRPVHRRGASRSGGRRRG